MDTLVAIDDSKVRRKCNFCHSSVANSVKYGKLYMCGQVVAHYYCVLLSTKMLQKGEDEDGILGFLVSDILIELKRTKNIFCSFCGKGNASLECAYQKCKLNFHLPCSLKQGSLHQFMKKFLSYCYDHRPRQEVPEKALTEAQNSQVICSICYEDVDYKSVTETLWAPCCAKTWYHRTCLQKLADSAGYFFKCAICNNTDKFKSCMLRFGIFIPKQDASWELEPNAFEELLFKYNNCDAEDCKCPAGRKENSKNTMWEIVLCDSCGSQGIHINCGNLKFHDPVWECLNCQNVSQKQSGSTSSLTTVCSALTYQSSASTSTATALNNETELRSETETASATGNSSVPSSGTSFSIDCTGDSTASQSNPERTRPGNSYTWSGNSKRISRSIKRKCQPWERRSYNKKRKKKGKTSCFESRAAHFASRKRPCFSDTRKSSAGSSPSGFRQNSEDDKAELYRPAAKRRHKSGGRRTRSSVSDENAWPTDGSERDAINTLIAELDDACKSADSAKNEEASSSVPSISPTDSKKEVGRRKTYDEDITRMRPGPLCFKLAVMRKRVGAWYEGSVVNRTGASNNGDSSGDDSIIEVEKPQKVVDTIDITDEESTSTFSNSQRSDLVKVNVKEKNDKPEGNPPARAIFDDLESKRCRILEESLNSSLLIVKTECVETSSTESGCEDVGTGVRDSSENLQKKDETRSKSGKHAPEAKSDMKCHRRESIELPIINENEIVEINISKELKKSSEKNEINVINLDDDIEIDTETETEKKVKEIDGPKIEDQKETKSGCKTVNNNANDIKPAEENSGKFENIGSDQKVPAYTTTKKDLIILSGKVYEISEVKDSSVISMARFNQEEAKSSPNPQATTESVLLTDQNKSRSESDIGADRVNVVSEKVNLVASYFPTSSTSRNIANLQMSSARSVNNSVAGSVANNKSVGQVYGGSSVNVNQEHGMTSSAQPKIASTISQPQAVKPASTTAAYNSVGSPTSLLLNQLRVPPISQPNSSVPVAQHRNAVTAPIVTQVSSLANFEIVGSVTAISPEKFVAHSLPNLSAQMVAGRQISYSNSTMAASSVVSYDASKAAEGHFSPARRFQAPRQVVPGQQYLNQNVRAPGIVGSGVRTPMANQQTVVRNALLSSPPRQIVRSNVESWLDQNARMPQSGMFPPGVPLRQAAKPAVPAVQSALQVQPTLPVPPTHPTLPVQPALPVQPVQPVRLQGPPPQPERSPRMEDQNMSIKILSCHSLVSSDYDMSYEAARVNSPDLTQSVSEPPPEIEVLAESITPPKRTTVPRKVSNLRTPTKVANSVVNRRKSTPQSMRSPQQTISPNKPISSSNKSFNWPEDLRRKPPRPVVTVLRSPVRPQGKPTAAIKPREKNVPTAISIKPTKETSSKDLKSKETDDIIVLDDHTDSSSSLTYAKEKSASQEDIIELD